MYGRSRRPLDVFLSDVRKKSSDYPQTRQSGRHGGYERKTDVEKYFEDLSDLQLQRGSPGRLLEVGIYCFQNEHSNLTCPEVVLGTIAQNFIA